MKVLLIFILFLILVGAIVYYEKRLKKIKTGKTPLEKAREILKEKKEKNKEKILEEVKRKGKITNDEVQALLNVSDATATNYLEELEKERKIKQVGKRGRSVYYQLNG